jgi:hypothetical protein
VQRQGGVLMADHLIYLRQVRQVQQWRAVVVRQEGGHAVRQVRLPAVSVPASAKLTGAAYHTIARCRRRHRHGARARRLQHEPTSSEQAHRRAGLGYPKGCDGKIMRRETKR